MAVCTWLCISDITSDVPGSSLPFIWGIVDQSIIEHQSGWTSTVDIYGVDDSKVDQELSEVIQVDSVDGR